MAFVIPSNLASRSDVRTSVQGIVRLLRDHLREQVTVFLDVREEDAPLWVIDPEQGVLAVHVLDGGARSLQKRIVELLGRQPRLQEVLDRAHEEVGKVLARLEQSPHLDRDIATRSTVAMPTETRRRVAASGHDSDELLMSDDLRPTMIAAAIARLLGGRTIHMTVPEERAVRAAISPEIIIRDRLRDEDRHRVIAFRAPEADDGDVLAVLDREQQNLAMNLGEGYRVIRGVAGSGKSVVLVHRARYLAESDPNIRILLTCYNIVIGRALAAEVADIDNVEVRHIDSLAFQVTKAAGIKVVRDGTDRWVHEQRLHAAKLLRKDGARSSYDVVLVDEGQDFDGTTFDLAHAALGNPAGDFVIALDGAQNIYRTRARWNPQGLTARGRTTYLRRNYRNTHEILTFAYGMLLRGGAEVHTGEGDLDDDPVVVTPEATSRRGPRPVVVSARNIDAEIRGVCAQLEAWSREGTRWSDMLVLFGNARSYQGRLYYECQRRDIPYYCISFSPRNKRGVLEAGNTVRSSTIQSVKGVEFPYVAVCGVNQIAGLKGEEDDDIAHRRLLYVGLTRATDHLFVTVSGDGPIGRDLAGLAG